MSEQTPSYGFTNTYEPSPQAKALGTVIEALKYRPDTSGTFMENLMNPANLYVTTGMVKGPGWGAEALRRYRLLGGTPETLNYNLKMRAMHPDSRTEIVKNFRQGTDLAAPAVLREDAPWESMGSIDTQRRAFDLAGTIYEQMPRGGRPHTGWGTGPAQDRIFHRPDQPTHESAAAGNAAYAAVSRQVARMLDTPGFYFKRAQDLPRVSAKEYNKAFPSFTERHPGTPAAELREQIRRDLGLLPSEARFMERNARQRTRIMQEHSDMVDRSIDAHEAGNTAEANRLMDIAEEFARRNGMYIGPD